MRLEAIIPIVGVKDLAKTKVFYEETLGFETVVQNDWYLHLRASGDSKLEIGFVISNHPIQPAIFQKPFRGEGVFYSLQVADVDQEYQRLKQEGIPIKLEKRTEPWGETHFAIEDPNGIVINISKTNPEDRGKVSMTEHMMEKEK